MALWIRAANLFVIGSLIAPARQILKSTLRVAVSGALLIIPVFRFRTVFGFINKHPAGLGLCYETSTEGSVICEGLTGQNGEQSCLKGIDTKGVIGCPLGGRRTLNEIYEGKWTFQLSLVRKTTINKKK